MLDAYTAIRTKRDTRAYSERPIPEAVVQRIIQAGRMAGSSKNTQPCRLVVIRDLEQRRQEAERLARSHTAGHPLVIVTSSETGLGIPELRAEMAALAA